MGRLIECAREVRMIEAPRPSTAVVHTADKKDQTLPFSILVIHNSPKTPKLSFVSVLLWNIFVCIQRRTDHANPRTIVEFLSALRHTTDHRNQSRPSTQN